MYNGSLCYDQLLDLHPPLAWLAYSCVLLVGEVRGRKGCSMLRPGNQHTAERHHLQVMLCCHPLAPYIQIQASCSLKQLKALPTSLAGIANRLESIFFLPTNLVGCQPEAVAADVI